MFPSVNRELSQPRGRWQALIVVLAICGLTVSLATRTFRLTVPHAITVKSGSAEAMRQHLNRDAVGWIPPIPVLSLLPQPASYRVVAPSGPPLPIILIHDSLYNRPPPSSSC
jgi:hypothetical protein